MKHGISVIAILAALSTGGFATSVGAVPASPPTLLAENDKAEKGELFKGKVEAVDAEAKTLTVDGAVIAVTATTKLTKAGKEIKLTEIKVGDQIHGRARKNAEGKTEAIKIQVGGEKK